jgi:RimJ/RimL family protein N-acetyltransferase
VIEHPWRVHDPIASDGTVTLRPPERGDATTLIAGRDDEWQRWLGPGNEEPAPTACIVVDNEIIGWVDYDTDREWLEPGEVNVGYNVFAPYRRRGYATRAVRLLVEHLGRTTSHRTVTLLIDAGNVASLAVAAKLRCESHGDVGGNRYFKLPIDQHCE